MFEPEIFRNRMYCIEESTCDIVGTFRRPRSHSAPGKLCPPCPPSLRPCAGLKMCLNIRNRSTWAIKLWWIHLRTSLYCDIQFITEW